jgi:hypothetical protein
LAAHGPLLARAGIGRAMGWRGIFRRLNGAQECLGLDVRPQ